MRRAGLGLAFIVALVTPILAGEEDGLADAIRQAGASQDPITTFFAAFLPLPDHKLSRLHVQSALAAANVTVDNATASALLANFQSYTKHGGSIDATNANDQSTAIVVNGENKGWLHLSKHVHLTIRREGNDVVIDDVDGIDMSKEKDSTHAGLRKIRIRKDHGKTVADATVKVFLFKKTVTILLDDPATHPTAARPDSTRAPTTVPTGGPPTAGIADTIPH